MLAPMPYPLALGIVGLDLVVERLVGLVGALDDLLGHRARPGRIGCRHTRGPRSLQEPACDRAAVTAIREHEHAHAGLETAPQREEFIVHQLAIEEDPGLVVRVFRLVAVGVRHLAAVPGIGEQEGVAALQLPGRGRDGDFDRVGRCLFVEQHAGCELLLACDGRHIFGVLLTALQLAVPTLVVIGVHAVETDVERHTFCHGNLPVLTAELHFKCLLFAGAGESFVAVLSTADRKPASMERSSLLCGYPAGFSPPNRRRRTVARSCAGSSSMAAGTMPG